MLKSISDMPTAQKIAMTIAILGLLSGSTTQLTDILSPFGSAAPVIVKEIVSLAGFVTGILGVVLTYTTGQVSQIQAVRSMPGVEKVLVNSKASPDLATLAMDESEKKIEAIPSAMVAVAATAAKNI